MSEQSDRETGARFNQRWRVGAAHALYIHDGHWYHQLKRFPGALFDRNGYLLFDTEDEFHGGAGVLGNVVETRLPSGLDVISQPLFVRTLRIIVSSPCQVTAAS